jgi:hypothetical protein
MADQPTALRLADRLEAAHEYGYDPEAAAELRRLHAVNAELTENLEKKSVAIQRIWKERDELRKANAELLEALKAVLPNVAMQAVGCRGDRCREAWCWSCFGEESAEASAQAGCDAYAKANAAIAKTEEQK